MSEDLMAITGDICVRCGGLPCRCFGRPYVPFVKFYTPQPHRCPVCNGAGCVHKGFYLDTVATSTEPDQCRTCLGQGVLWR